MHKKGGPEERLKMELSHSSRSEITRDWMTPLPIEKGRRKRTTEGSMGSEVTEHLLILKYTRSLRNSLSFGFEVQMCAVRCQNIRGLVSRVNKPISFQAKLRQVRLSQFSSLPRKEIQAPFSHLSGTLKKYSKKFA